MLTNNYPGSWGTFHIIYFVISTLLVITSLILIKKYIKKEKTLNLVIKITSLVLLLLIITNRISYTVQHVMIEHKEGYNWTYIFPETFCALSCLLFSISTLVGKKNNVLMHGSFYMALIGAFTVAVFPDFLNRQGLLEVGTITSLIYHTLMLFLALLVLITYYFKPSIKRWYIQPIVNISMICYGLFYLSVFCNGEAPFSILGINKPFVDGQPILCSWYMMSLGYLVFELLFTVIYELIINKKSIKKITYEFIHLNH